jgi:crossover junction endodeoxyribonuclease RusA
MITIEVRGLPAPQGSKRHVGNGRMIESSKKVEPWREAVRAETQRAMRSSDVTPLAPLDGPIVAWVTFRLPRPASAPRRILVPAKYPDTEKLVRSTWDAITAGGGWADDARVVELHAYKVFATPEFPPGALIMFGAWQPADAVNPFASYAAALTAAGATMAGVA